MKSSWETISSFGWHQAGIPRKIYFVRNYCFNSPIVKGHTQSLLRISSLLPGWSHFKGISPDRGSYLCCKPLHSLVHVSHLFNKWGVHEKWRRWRHGGRRKEVSGGGHSSERKEKLPSVICVRATLRGGAGELKHASQQDVKNDQGRRLLESQVPSFQKEGEQKCIPRHPFRAGPGLLDFSNKWPSVFPLVVLRFSPHFHIEILPDTEYYSV